jgi:hypothetical protein
MRAPLVLPSVVLVAALAGCTTAVALQPAELANDPACAEVMVRLPDTVAGLERRSTNAQSTAAWGDPAAVILRCGLPPTGPSPLPCATLDNIDWLRDGSNDPNFAFITFGRSPAVEVLVDSRKVSGTSALGDLDSAVGNIVATDHCLDPADPLN